jgi:hypothetical protein
MHFLAKFGLGLLLASGFLLVWSTHLNPQPTSPGTTRFSFEDNRVFVELLFVRPDGSVRRAWSFVDIGTPSPVVSSALYRDLQLDRQKQFTFRIGNLPINVDAAEVVKSDRLYGFRKNTEFVLPGSVMRCYQVTIDYAKRTLTFGVPGAAKLDGIAIPCRVNDASGLVSIEVSVEGCSYRAAIDDGAAYIWLPIERC